MVDKNPSKNAASSEHQTVNQTKDLYENVNIDGANDSSKEAEITGEKEYTAPTPSGDIELTRGGIPEKDPGVAPRGEFSNSIQYLLACIGYAVGLGNIWRFPSVAYENGGGAFLIPYMLVSIFFGLPTLYIECALGQFTQFGPSKAFKFYMPISQGIGWAMSLIALSIALYYNVIVAWSMIYLGYTVTDNMHRFSSCDNWWNTQNCTDTVYCKEEKYLFGSCYSADNYTVELDAFRYAKGYNATFVSAPDEFFTQFITRKHLSFDHGEYNWKVAGCLVLCWVLTALGLVFGVKWLGRISVVTATVPYVIIITLLVKGVTLPGAMIGIEKYLTKPDFTYLYKPETWKAALTQICFSLSVGQGGMLAMSSYNKRSHKCFKDAVLVMIADCLMSIIGGVAVFSVLGYMAKNSGKEFYEVVPSPLSLAFVVYPEVISHMSVPHLWSILFFFMIFMLGISTMFGLLEGFITCLCDSFEFFRARHALTVIGTCIISLSIGLFFFCSQNGYHYFNIFNSYIGSFSLAVIIVFEIIVVVGVYGPRYFFRDMEAQFGRPTTNCSRLLGPNGLVIKLLMCITAPLFALGVLAVTLYDVCTGDGIVDKIGIDTFHYPTWTMMFGLSLAVVPLSAIPILCIVNCCSSLTSGKGIGSAFRVADNHPSIVYNLNPVPSIGQFLWPTEDRDTSRTTRRESEKIHSLNQQ